MRTLNTPALPARHAGASFCTGMSIFAIVILLLLAAAVSRDYRCVPCACLTCLRMACATETLLPVLVVDTPCGSSLSGAQIHRPGLEGQP